MSTPDRSTDPHAGQPVLRAGVPIANARRVVLLAHGRGGSAEDILMLADAVGGEDIAWVAPQAADRTWYPHSFLEPIDRNEPKLTSALGVLMNLVDSFNDQGIGADRVVLVGFSQGACLSLEFAARQPRRYGGVAALSGGLIGPPGTPREYQPRLGGTPVLVACSDIDPHIPLARVEESAAVFTRLGAEVDLRIYPGMGHTVNPDEIGAVRAMVSQRIG